MDERLDYLTPSEMASTCGVTVDTLRYYEHEQLLGPVARTRGQQRRYSPEDVAWVKILRCLRATAMPVREMQRFAQLVRDGDAATTDVLDLLRQHRQAVLLRRAELDDALDVIEKKIHAYERGTRRLPSVDLDLQPLTPTLGGKGARR